MICSTNCNKVSAQVEQSVCSETTVNAGLSLSGVFSDGRPSPVAVIPALCGGEGRAARGPEKAAPVLRPAHALTFSLFLQVGGLLLEGCSFDGSRLSESQHDSPSVSPVPPCFVGWVRQVRTSAVVRGWSKYSVCLFYNV